MRLYRDDIAFGRTMVTFFIRMRGSGTLEIGVLQPGYCLLLAGLAFVLVLG